MTHAFLDAKAFRRRLDEENLAPVPEQILRTVRQKHLCYQLGDLVGAKEAEAREVALMNDFVLGK